MSTKRIQLVSAGLSERYVKSPRTGVYPPLHIASLGAYLHRAEPGAEVQLLDGEILTNREICHHLDADVVGISCNVMTYRSALGIAEVAAKKGSRVLLGGPYPSAFARRILRLRPFVDAVVVGDGEPALRGYINGAPYDSIPNLCFRRNGEAIESFQQALPLDGLPFADYMNLPLTLYFDRFSSRYGSFKPFRKSLAVYSRKGCLWRDRSHGGCIFCMIPHSGLRYKRPERLWEEIKFFNTTLGVNHFWEVSDTFTENSKWIDEFVSLRPDDLDVSFNVYGRASNISPMMARRLKELQVDEVFLGVESGDNRILTLANKGTTADQSLRAVEALANSGLRAVVSFVLGLPGETARSLDRTAAFARELLSFGNIVETSCSVMLPIPGSQAFATLCERADFERKYSGDLFDLEELKHDWITEFTYVTLDEVESAVRETMTMFPLNDSFAQPQTRSAPMC